MTTQEDIISRAAQADNVHDVLAALLAERDELKAENDALKKPADTPNNSYGGEPVPHHLHLVDGRVINDHDGIGTHYTERLPDGTTKVTRVHAHYRVNEPDPTTVYA